MPRHDQRKGRVLRAPAGHSAKLVSSGKIRSAENRHGRGHRKNGLRDNVMQDQLFSQCRETIQTKMVRAL
jgi:hypothetical protein